jgi:hypothetical protein
MTRRLLVAILTVLGLAQATKGAAAFYLVE